MEQEINMQEIVGRGYGAFWNFRGRYRVVKGGRASKKSKTAALWFIYHMLRYPEANLLVVRQTGRTLKDSCCAELLWAIDRLGVRNLWTATVSPLELTLKNTGQKIFFRGLDDPLKVTSIGVRQGSLCWMWIEEACEVRSEADFDTLDESIRGNTGPFRQITLTFNPWNERHWLKKRFFDCPPDENILAMTTDYRCNEWLSDSDRALFERMRVRNPARYQVAGLGNWGIEEGLIYENWTVTPFEEALLRSCIPACGLDFGYAEDPAAAFIGYIDPAGKRLFVWQELYEKGLSNRRLYQKIRAMGCGQLHFTADSAEPKSIDELKSLGLHVSPAKKGTGSIAAGISWLSDFEIIIHPRCENFIAEISGYCWEKTAGGEVLTRPVDRNNHLMDAMRYAVERFRVRNGWMA